MVTMGVMTQAAETGSPGLAAPATSHPDAGHADARHPDVSPAPRGPRRHRARRGGSRSKKSWLRLISPVLVLVLWQLASSTGLIAGLSRVGENTADPLMQMLRTLPLFGLIFVALLGYCALGLLTDAIVRQIERRALTWRRGLQVWRLQT